MIVIGVDVHKQSLTAVAVDEVGRGLAELTADRRRNRWLVGLALRRAVWAVEDCRHLTSVIEQTLLPRVSGWCGCRRS